LEHYIKAMVPIVKRKVNSCIGVKARITNGTSNKKYYVAKCLFCNQSNIIPVSYIPTENAKYDQACNHAVGIHIADEAILFERGEDDIK